VDLEPGDGRNGQAANLAQPAEQADRPSLAPQVTEHKACVEQVASHCLQLLTTPRTAKVRQPPIDVLVGAHLGMVLIGPRAGSLLKRGDLFLQRQTLFERLEDEPAALPGGNMLA
jgi:hypothetical protein